MACARNHAEHRELELGDVRDVQHEEVRELAEAWRDEAIYQEEAEDHVDFFLDEGTEDLSEVGPDLIFELSPAAILILCFAISNLLFVLFAFFG